MKKLIATILCLVMTICWAAAEEHRDHQAHEREEHVTHKQVLHFLEEHLPEVMQTMRDIKREEPQEFDLATQSYRWLVPQ